MELLHQITVPRRNPTQPPAVIQLLAGDLSRIPAEHAVDVLVVSAFPDDYEPFPGTLFASLRAQGLDMIQVARQKQVDERRLLGCWLSTALPDEVTEHTNIERILCFEPSYPEFLAHSENHDLRIDDRIGDQVGYVFRCLNNFAIPDLAKSRNFTLARVAMPLLATGNQGGSVDALLPGLLEAAQFWLGSGLPIDVLKIVAYEPDDVAAALKIFRSIPPQEPPTESLNAIPLTVPPSFTNWQSELAEAVAHQVITTCRQRLEEDLLRVADDQEATVLRTLFSRIASTPPPAATPRYDVFLSYSHKQETEAKSFVAALRKQAPGLRLFYDRTSIPPGEQWIRLISDAVQQANTFVAILSPDYSASRVCWDEFQCAKLKEYTTRKSVIKTIRLYQDPDLPPMMAIHSFVDCTEGDLSKLQQAALTVPGS